MIINKRARRLRGSSELTGVKPESETYKTADREHRRAPRRCSMGSIHNAAAELLPATLRHKQNICNDMCILAAVKWTCQLDRSRYKCDLCAALSLRREGGGRRGREPGPRAAVFTILLRGHHTYLCVLVFHRKR